MIIESTKRVLLKGKQIRKTIFENEWWFVVADVVSVLTNTVNPNDYINKMRRLDPELAKGYGQIVHILPIDTEGGDQRMDCAKTEGIFRIIQSIPSPLQFQTEFGSKT
ncbi:MAG: Bro-N domain-containing protein [bacterium]|nr:MAG: Bro-N domain-containing protein [bacterium]